MLNPKAVDRELYLYVLIERALWQTYQTR